MDIDKAKGEGRCFKCGKVGHISCNCQDQKIEVWAVTQKEVEEKTQEGFQDTQQWSWHSWVKKILIYM